MKTEESACMREERPTPFGAASADKGDDGVVVDEELELYAVL